LPPDDAWILLRRRSGGGAGGGEGYGLETGTVTVESINTRLQSRHDGWVGKRVVDTLDAGLEAIPVLRRAKASYIRAIVNRVENRSAILLAFGR